MSLIWRYAAFCGRSIFVRGNHINLGITACFSMLMRACVWKKLGFGEIQHLFVAKTGLCFDGTICCNQKNNLRM